MKENREEPLEIYLVEDDVEDQRFFSEALSEVQDTVHLTILSNGMELMQSLESASKLPDIIFLDLIMPEMNGEACLERIRIEARYDSIPVLIFSTLYHLETVERLFAKGANRYLQKPVVFSALVYSLEITLESLRKNGLGSPTVYRIN